MFFRRLKDVTKKTSFLRCIWDVLKTSQKRHLFWDISEKFLRYLSQWRSDWDLSEISHASCEECQNKIAWFSNSYFFKQKSVSQSLFLVPWTDLFILPFFFLPINKDVPECFSTHALFECQTTQVLECPSVLVSIVFGCSSVLWVPKCLCSSALVPWVPKWP